MTMEQLAIAAAFGFLTLHGVLILQLERRVDAIAEREKRRGGGK
jgi:hypothetical protein